MPEAMDGGQLRRREVPAAIWKGGGSSLSLSPSGEAARRWMDVGKKGGGGDEK